MPRFSNHFWAILPFLSYDKMLRSYLERAIYELSDRSSHPWWSLSWTRYYLRIYMPIYVKAWNCTTWLEKINHHQGSDAQCVRLLFSGRHCASKLGRTPAWRATDRPPSVEHQKSDNVILRKEADVKQAMNVDPIWKSIFYNKKRLNNYIAYRYRPPKVRVKNLSFGGVFMVR